MDRMQRSFTKLMNKAPGDNAKVALILKEYDDAIQFLGKIIDGSKALRDAWLSVANCQYVLVKEYAELYDPPVGELERPTRPTPVLQVKRTFGLREAYNELKSDLLQEVAGIDVQVIRPATDALEFIQPMRKTIKKRENKRLDYEKAQDKVKKLQKKTSRTTKEDAALSKAESEMNVVSEEFQIADDHLRRTLPPLICSVSDLVPYLLASLATIENRLLGLYYTVLHGYCQDHEFPSPPPPMDQVISQWASRFKPVQSETESMSILARGKAVRMPMAANYDSQSGNPAPRNSQTRNTSGFLPGLTENNGTEPTRRTTRIPSTSSAALSNKSDASPQSSRQSSQSALSRSKVGLPTDFTTATSLGQSPGSGPLAPGYTPSRERSDYFEHQSQLVISTVASPQGRSASGGIMKKKPPPPPPTKRAQQAPVEYVIAEHNFTSDQDGDLSFREGDRIKIVKKTQKLQDWWVGELGGVQGNFPANYCRPT
ncbi:SH3 domain signaling protein [Sodiomyces alkalinus F11]|uniref:SH3 domain signaling protein n=1 Tax=Sodiomyces alkalinus (strain CBS 110278 / VKM F-3762 / F11) TaxID=1314773 RepID=A0A3N2PSM0_SODAK|nr:SH3 domain signaling protein [Sodiomyces alkalinus F11]ROT37513.1 SH3 domain signaling protein [Sodiomyces alkalinus F11]